MTRRARILAALALAALPWTAAAAPDSPPPQVVLFRSAGFPSVDAAPVSEATLEEALRGLEVARVSSAGELARALARQEAPPERRVLVLSYGSAFPLEAWEAIRSFLGRGGGLAVLGGAPFGQPVLWQAGPKAPAGGSWTAGTRQPSFAHALLIGPAEALDVGRLDPAGRALSARFAEGSGLGPVPGSAAAAFDPTQLRGAHAFALTVRFATLKDLPGEDGSAGPRDALLRPLVHLVDADGIPRACPLLEIDRLRGDGAGGRWVFATTDAPLDAAHIRFAVTRALEGAALLDARPALASVEPSEPAIIRIHALRPRADRVAGLDAAPPSGASRAAGAAGQPAARSASGGAPLRVTIVARDASGATVFEGQTELRGAAYGEIAVRPRAPLKPGLYRVDVAAPDVPWHPNTATTGFWVRDEALLRSGEPLAVSRDWLRRGGRVYPVVGTTYMASDVHRKFLFEPNPALWDRDFADMARAGVNLVRTGLWTAWSRLMLDPGAIDEGALRALDAFVLTAARHGIPVCFTFFAFQPPAFGGDNPYLDPRALQGQGALVQLIARRYRDSPWVHYDLINEPSYSPADQLWTNQPIGDRFERARWETWLKLRAWESVLGPNDSPDPDLLRDMWRDASPDPLALPTPRELSQAAVRDGRRPRKAFDFARFAQDVLADWAAGLRRTLRAVAKDALVTLGQDEGGLGSRAAPPFYAAPLDYTAVHTWWLNDDLLADTVLTRVRDRPHLVQETGLMRLEDADGVPWRTPEQAAALLERKLALAFAGRAAGVVQWAWNVNPYQPIDNEAVIGLTRPDGTAKPERDVLVGFARFFAAAAPHLEDLPAPPVVVLIPHARLFSGRPLGVSAAQRVVRVLADRFATIPATVSDLRIGFADVAGAKLVIVPASEMIPEPAAIVLREAARKGTQVLVTGAIEGDPYGRVTPALRDLGVAAGSVPLSLREPTRWARGSVDSAIPAAAGPARAAEAPSAPVRSPAGEGAGWATFADNRAQWLRRAAISEPAPGSGPVWHEPLPLEFASEEEPLAALLGAALRAAGLPAEFANHPMTLSVLEGPRAALVTAVNETASTALARPRVFGRGLDLSVPAQRSRMLLVARDTGHVLARYPDTSR